MYKLKNFVNDTVNFVKDKVYDAPSYTRTGVGAATYAASTCLIFPILSNIPIEQFSDDQMKAISALILYIGSIVASYNFDKIGSYVLSYSAAIKDWAFRKPDAFRNAKLSVKSIYDEIKKGSFGDTVGYGLIALSFLGYSLFVGNNMYNAIYQSIFEAPDFGNATVNFMSLIGIAYLAGFFADMFGDTIDTTIYNIGKFFIKIHEFYEYKTGKKNKMSENRERIVGTPIQIVERSKVNADISEGKTRQEEVLQNPRVKELLKSKNIRDFARGLETLSDLNLSEDEKRILLNLFIYTRRENM
ncbi:MAG: hypothetical protein N3D75_02555 [Candidatus Aenigmarchaeota archaeon]|nr:hypothetical protein [Candidatus Aenigmarchaeota archaeon]